MRLRTSIFLLVSVGLLLIGAADFLVGFTGPICLRGDSDSDFSGAQTLSILPLGWKCTFEVEKTGAAGGFATWETSPSWTLTVIVLQAAVNVAYVTYNVKSRKPTDISGDMG